MSQFFCQLNSSKYFTCPLGKLRIEFSSGIAKSTSPWLSDTTFFARCFLQDIYSLAALTKPRSNQPAVTFRGWHNPGIFDALLSCIVPRIALALIAGLVHCLSPWHISVSTVKSQFMVLQSVHVFGLYLGLIQVIGRIASLIRYFAPCVPKSCR